MADSLTPNIGALIADPTDVIQYSAHVGNNYTLFDSLMGAVDCLSTARPSVTYKGQIIYERDSKRYAQNLASSAAPSWSYMSHSAMTATSSARPSSGLSTGLLAWETDSTGMVVWNGASWTHLSYKAFTCTSSTRPTGTSLFTGLQIWESDTARFLIWNGASWEQKSFANFVCTSSAHPSAPFQGLEIYESDTGLNAVYSGSNYQYALQQIAPTQILVGTTASVTFTGISGVYRRVVVFWRARSSAAALADVEVQLDGNTGNNYQWSKGGGTNGAASAGHGGGAVAFMKCGIVDGTTASYFSSGEFSIDGWANATGFATLSGRGALFSTSTVDAAEAYAGQFNVVGPHNSIKMLLSSNSFAAGTEISLYALM